MKFLRQSGSALPLEARFSLLSPRGAAEPATADFAPASDFTWAGMYIGASLGAASRCMAARDSRRGADLHRRSSTFIRFRHADRRHHRRTGRL